MSTSTRRTFLGRELPAALGAIATGGFLGDAHASTANALSIPYAPVKRLVCIFLRGGVDGLNLVVPHGDDDYYTARKEIAIARPAQGGGSALWLDPLFGLKPALSALAPLFRSHHVAAVHAVGSHDLTRSHFDAQDYMESGAPLDRSTRDGWLNRCIVAAGSEGESPLRAVALGNTLPRVLYGSAPALAIDDVDSFGVRAPGKLRARLQESFRKMYAAGQDEASLAGIQALNTVDLVRQKAGQKYTPENDAQYPRAGRALMNVARLLKADLGVQFAWVDAGGWDTHANQGAGEGQFAGKLKDLGDSLAAFHRDMGKRMQDVVVVTLSEFGRTVRQNGTGGTDHGHGGVMLVMGGGVHGGRVLGKWPGLAEQDRHEGRDLQVTTDFRAVVSEIVTQHLKIRNVNAVFPGYEWLPAQRLGLFG